MKMGLLLSLRPGPRTALVVGFNADHIRPAADRAILDVLLLLAGREVDRHDDLLAAPVAEVAGFVVHASIVGPVGPGGTKTNEREL